MGPKKGGEKEVKKRKEAGKAFSFCLRKKLGKPDSRNLALTPAGQNGGRGKTRKWRGEGGGC